MSLALRKLARAVLLSVLALAAPAASAAPAPFTPEQRQAVEGIVRDYLLKNPEVLQDVFAELERRQQEAQKTAQASALRSERDALLKSPHDFVIGNPSGDVTLVEFFDFNCGYCKRAMGDLKALIKADPKLRVVLKDFPILGPGSVEAARVALAAKQQLKGDKQFDFHVRLMETRGPVNGERALAVAKDMGLDMAKLQKDIDSEEVKATIRKNVELGDKLGLTGTPAFIVGEAVIFGAVGLDPLRQAVASARR